MRVLVLNEKHGAQYIAVPADKEGSVMLRIIKERHEGGWYEGSMDEEEEKLLADCLKNDMQAAVKFFRMRKNGEYEGWDLVEARVISTSGVYSPFPVQCRERHDKILEIADDLLRTFINGNRNTARDKLLDLEPVVALAVLSLMMFNASRQAREALAVYFVEVA